MRKVEFEGLKLVLMNFLGLDALARAKRAADTEKTGIVKRVHYLSAASQAEEVERVADEENPAVRENLSGAGARKYRERLQEDSDQPEDSDRNPSTGGQDRRSDHRDDDRYESRNESRNDSRYESRNDSRYESRNDSRYESRNDSRYDSRHDSRGERDRRSGYNDRDRSRRGHRNDYTPSASPMPSPSPRRSSISGMVQTLHFSFYALLTLVSYFNDHD